MPESGDVDTRVVLGNRDNRRLRLLPLADAKAADADAKDPRRLFDVDDDSGLARVSEPVPGKHATLAVLPAGTPLLEAVQTMLAGSGVWARQTHTAGEKPPAWVASDMPALAALLAEHWGCDVRDIDEAEIAASFGEAASR